MEENYFAVIPMYVMLDDKLTPLERLLYGVISSLTNKRGYCYASNQYFAKMFKKNDKYISGMIKSLKDNGYIAVSVEKGNCRKIEILLKNVSTEEGDVPPLSDSENHEARSEKAECGSEKSEPTHSENSEHNNKDINNKEDIYSAEENQPSTAPVSKSKNKKSSRIYPEDSEEYQLALFLLEHIWQNSPDMKKPNLQKWADEFRILLEGKACKKQVTAQQLRWRISFAYKDPFWSKGNIMSARKFREQSPKLGAAMNALKKQGKIEIDGDEVLLYDKSEDVWY